VRKTRALRRGSAPDEQSQPELPQWPTCERLPRLPPSKEPWLHLRSWPGASSFPGAFASSMCLSSTRLPTSSQSRRAVSGLTDTPKMLFKKPTRMETWHPPPQLHERTLVPGCPCARKEGELLIEGGKSSPHNVGRFRRCERRGRFLPPCPGTCVDAGLALAVAPDRWGIGALLLRFLFPNVGWNSRALRPGAPALPRASSVDAPRLRRPQRSLWDGLGATSSRHSTSLHSCSATRHFPCLPLLCRFLMV
jgi:hypothetical protein